MKESLAIGIVAPSGYVTDLSLLENRYQFQRYLRDRKTPQPNA